MVEALMQDFKGSFHKTHVHVQSGMTLPECMTLPENLPTTIFSVKLMNLCILPFGGKLIAES